ncbi:hypothetical protein CRG98_007583 [Punica granatum]|uniref:Uncharacterized protein n=1 Tax=Punica granatum TaxID=22663 RepID=A0A2I0KU84_PUNGR|nr:hypothetical protein CRG98_007583 [Punica granatum]
MEGSRSPIGGPNPSTEVAGIFHGYRRSRPLHGGHQRPSWVPATSVEGLRSPIGGPNPSFLFDFLCMTKMKQNGKVQGMNEYAYDPAKGGGGG